MILTQAVRIGRIVFKNGELVTIIAIQSVHGAKPHESLTILQDAGYRALGQTIL
jgi:translation elongation factor P/translation initiation factor 5A